MPVWTLHLIHILSKGLNPEAIKISKNMPDYFKRIKNVFYYSKYISLLNAILNVINLWQTVVHIFQCIAACKLNDTGRIFMTHFMKSSVCLHRLWFKRLPKKKKTKNTNSQEIETFCRHINAHTSKMHQKMKYGVVATLISGLLAKETKNTYSIHWHC